MRILNATIMLTAGLLIVKMFEKLFLFAILEIDHLSLLFCLNLRNDVGDVACG